MSSEDEKSTSSTPESIDAKTDAAVNEPGTLTRDEAAADRNAEAETTQKLTPAQKAAKAKAAREKKAAEAAAQAAAETPATASEEAPAEKLTPAQKAARAKAAREKKAAEAAAQAAAETPATASDEAPAEKLTPAQKAARAKAAREKKAAEATAAAKSPAATQSAPPAKDEKPVDPHVAKATETAERLAAALKQQFGETVVEEAGAVHHHPLVRIQTAKWADAVAWLKTHADWQLNYLECMAGTDYPDYIEIVIYVQSTELNHFICLKTRTSRDAAEVPSLVDSHPGVNWEEREIYDLLGVKFTNHPDLRRIMMWDDFKGHPLRKDYSEWESR